MGRVKDIALVVFSSSLLVLSFPGFDLGFLAWIGLVPLLDAIKGKTHKQAFILSLVCGMLFFMGIFYWILEIPGYTYLHHALLAIYLGLYFGSFGLLFSLVSRRLGLSHALWAAPFIWVCLEYIRSDASFLALPWALLAHSQYQYPIITQIAALSGTYGVSFLIILVNSALVSLLWSARTWKLAVPLAGGQAYGSHKEMRGLWIATIISLIFTLVYGHITISRPINGTGLRLSLVQGNIEQSKKWDPKHAREIMEIYTGLTQEASKRQPDLIIWPETATPGAISRNPRLFAELKQTVINAGVPLLLGSAQHLKFAAKESKRPKYTNSAYLIDPDPEVFKNQRYDKIRLFPFGEYVPLKGIIPWSLIDIRDSDTYVTGNKFTLFSLPHARFAVTICWENAFPDLVRQFVKRGAQFMVNITNEAHFGKTAAPYQLLSISVLRAVENRIYVVRCANTGVSCIIDPHGRVVDRVKDGGGKDIFVRGFITGSVVPLESNTIYTRYGNLWLWVCIAGSMAFLVRALLKRRNVSK
jgi:apolipoprotein N-acyltransferase